MTLSNWPSRAYKRQGEKHSRSRISWEIVRAIRSSKERTVTLARKYMLSADYVSEIRTGKVWKDDRNLDKQ